MLQAKSTAETQPLSPAAQQATPQASGIGSLCIQARLTVGAPNDIYEKEADEVAERVMRMPQQEAFSPFDGSGIQRRGAACDEDDKKHIQTKPFIQRQAEEDEELQTKPLANRLTPFVQRKSDSGGAASEGLTSQINATGGSGSPLSEGSRSFMESRFGADFSGVRVHTGGESVQMNRALNAQAFTVGRDVYFGQGKYSPESSEGKRLLGHELTHVVQQGAVNNHLKSRNSSSIAIMRQPAPFRTRRFQERGGGGTTDFIETVQNMPARNGNIISGRVNRSEVAPASGSTPAQTIHSGAVNVQFDTSTCILSIPYNFAFTQTTAATPPFCQDPPNSTPVQPLPTTELDALKQQYINYINEGLNGLFIARISGCQNSCANSEIPIQVIASQNSLTPDQIINIVNRSGRGNAGTICVGNMDRRFAVHESGHQVLGLGDEYRENDPSLIQQMTTWGRNERVRSDLTYMGPETEYGRFSLFHQRHFRFAQVFLESAFPGCTVTLEEVSRIIPDFRFVFDAGYAHISGGHGISMGLGFDVGLPLTRLRQTELLIGVRGRMLAEASGRYRYAFLVGAQIGLEHRTSPANVAAIFGLTLGGGASYQSSSSSWTPYLEGAASLGVSSGMLGSGVSLSARLEAAAGREVANTPEALRWVRVGARIGLAF